MTVGAILVAWFTGDNLIALDTMDFWMGTLSLYLITALFLIIFNVVWRSDNALRELGRGASFIPPRIFGFIIRWVTPTILLCVFGSWLYKNIFVELSPQVAYVLEGKPGAIFPLGWMLLIVAFCAAVAYTSNRFRAPKSPTGSDKNNT